MPFPMQLDPCLHLLLTPMQRLKMLVMSGSMGLLKACTAQRVTNVSATMKSHKAHGALNVTKIIVTRRFPDRGHVRKSLVRFIESQLGRPGLTSAQSANRRQVQSLPIQGAAQDLVDVIELRSRVTRYHVFAQDHGSVRKQGRSLHDVDGVAGHAGTPLVQELGKQDVADQLLALTVRVFHDFLDDHLGFIEPEAR
eukprot:757890-Hanusia_phi.AAC.4